jgi:hypothetical protein
MVLEGTEGCFLLENEGKEKGTESVEKGPAARWAFSGSDH